MINEVLEQLEAIEIKNPTNEEISKAVIRAKIRRGIDKGQGLSFSTWSYAREAAEFVASWRTARAVAK